MKLSASIRAGRTGLPSRGYQLATIAAALSMGTNELTMTIPKRYGGGRKQVKTAALEAAYPELKRKWPNAAYNRWIPRKNKQHRLKGLRP